MRYLFYKPHRLAPEQMGLKQGPHRPRFVSSRPPGVVDDEVIRVELDQRVGASVGSTGEGPATWTRDRGQVRRWSAFLSTPLLDETGAGPK